MAVCGKWTLVLSQGCMMSGNIGMMWYEYFKLNFETNWSIVREETKRERLTGQVRQSTINHHTNSGLVRLHPMQQECGALRCFPVVGPSTAGRAFPTETNSWTGHPRTVHPTGKKVCLEYDDKWKISFISPKSGRVNKCRVVNALRDGPFFIVASRGQEDGQDCQAQREGRCHVLAFIGVSLADTNGHWGQNLSCGLGSIEYFFISDWSLDDKSDHSPRAKTKHLKNKHPNYH